MDNQIVLNIKDSSKLAFFLEVIKSFDFVSVKEVITDNEIEDNTELHQWQKDIINERLEKIADGNEKFHDFETAINEIENEL